MKKSSSHSSAEEMKAVVEEFEKKLLEKHPDKYSRYRIKFWAEMLANGGYSDLDNPPAGAAMFNRDHSIKRSKVPVESGNEAMMSGMLAVVNTLCQAVLPQNRSTSPKT